MTVITRGSKRDLSIDAALYVAKVIHKDLVWANASTWLQQPMSLCVNDYFKTGKTEPVLCYYIQGKNYPYASRNEILEDMPILKKRFFYYKDYAVAGFNDIFLPEQQKGMLDLKVNQLKNCWLENTGKGQLVLHELHIAAQFSAIQSAVIADINKDGVKEIFTAGNVYPFRVQLGREDAGKGVLLKLDKNKHTHVQPSLLMGLCVDGDVRDVKSVETANHEQIVIISKNNESVKVIQQTVRDSQNKLHHKCYSQTFLAQNKNIASS